MKIDTLIFDMDGVITTEEKYWACARLALWELVTHTLSIPYAFGDPIHDVAAREAVTPDSLIYALKGRAVNSNWDICYILACLYISGLPNIKVLLASSVDEILASIHEQIAVQLRSDGKEIG